MSLEFTIITICIKSERQKHTKRGEKRLIIEKCLICDEYLYLIFIAGEMHTNGVTYADRLMQQG